MDFISQKLEGTCYANYKLMVDKQGKPFGVMIDGKVAFLQGDRVRVTADCIGYICPGITKPGLGTIAAICRDSTDHFFEVNMDNGQSGTMKSARLTLISRRATSC